MNNFGDEKNTCCICDSELEKGKYVIVSANKTICLDCVSSVSMIGNLMEKNDDSKCSEEIDMKKINSPKEIKAFLDKYVIGQERAKKVLSVAAYNHYKRAFLRDPGIQKSNVLFVGPTGCGKTYLVKTLAKALGVPLAIVPSTNLTEAGYIGDDVSSVVERLYEESGRDLVRTEKGIIFIDEIDKLTSSSSSTEKKVGGKGVQQALLPILEGTMVKIHGGDSFIPNREASMITVDTTNILFICGGAFPDAEVIIKKRLGKLDAAIGFSQNREVEEELDNILMNITNDDLKEFGLIPELLGRLPIITPLERLTKETLKKILVEPENSLVSQYRKLFKVDGVELVFEDAALDYIVEKAENLGTGARSLRSIMEDILLDLMYEIPSDKTIRQVTVTKEYILGEKSPGISFQMQQGACYY